MNADNENINKKEIDKMKKIYNIFKDAQKDVSNISVVPCTEYI